MNEHPELIKDSPKLAQLETDLVGNATDDVFARATYEYLLSTREIVGKPHPNGLGRLRHLNFELLQSVWTKKF